jgi:hypothetical protein
VSLFEKINNESIRKAKFGREFFVPKREFFVISKAPFRKNPPLFSIAAEKFREESRIRRVATQKPIVREHSAFVSDEPRAEDLTIGKSAPESRLC